MEAVSQVILRNEARLPAGPVLLVNPPRDALALRLQQTGRDVRCSHQDFGDYRWLQSAGVDVSFEVFPVPDENDHTMVLFLPREKERLAMLLHAISDGLNAQARLWLVGENRGGIKSSPRLLQARFRQVTTLDKARHCGLLEAGGPIREKSFELAEYAVAWSTHYAGREIQLRSLPGVFAQGRLDRGTALLLEVVKGHRPQGRLLDFACGCGVIGIALLAVADRAALTLLDSSALAIESSRQSLALNGLQADLLPSDGLAELRSHARGRYDWIVSNPPFHRGVASDFDVAAGFFRGAGTFLSENGRMVIVFNRHLPYSQWLGHAFERVERVADSGDFIVVLADRPRGEVRQKRTGNSQTAQRKDKLI